MKTFVPTKFIRPVFLAVHLFIVLVSFSQGIPELQFTNGVLESGNAGEDGATYRFANVTSGIDALVLIKGRSSTSVVLSSIDTSGPGLGYDKAFQPVLGIPGVAPALSNWSMDFQINFYKTGTTKKIKLSQFNVTGLDIDGDGLTLSEWTQMNGLQYIDSAIVNSLTFSQLGHSGHGLIYKVEGIIANSPGIDTTAKNVMATYRYTNEDEVDFTIGAKTSILPTTAGMRLNSIWFKDFLGVVLPVKLESFNAGLNNGIIGLDWITASEMNVSHFEIEKSLDGKDFGKIGRVEANGNSSTELTYHFADLNTQTKAPVLYYRLKMIDNDEKIEYSQVRVIRTVDNGARKATVLSYPNPVANELHVILPSNWQNKDVSYSFVKANGQIVKQVRTTNGGQAETFSLNDFAPGIYMLTINCGNEKTTQKLIKS